jgi:hypothetical protein
MAAASPTGTVSLSTPETKDVQPQTVNTCIAAQRVKADIPCSAVPLRARVIRTNPAIPRSQPPITTKEPKTTTPPASLSTCNPSLPTPIRAHRLNYHLQNIGYDRNLTQFLVNGFTSGFSLGHTQEPENIISRNSRAADHNEAVVADKLQKEILAGRILGPFDERPFTPFQISPLNIRAKKTPNKYRLLHNLSHPYDGRSINANIPDSNKTVKYSTVGDAIQKLLKLPPSAYTAKTDISDAFRLLPISPSDYPKLGMKFQDKYYYDRCLPQGCGSSCQIFETFSTAIHSILEAYAPDAVCIHMLDDFLILAETKQTCSRHLDLLLQLCDDIGIPMAPDKTTLPSTNTTFLGIELDTINRQAKLPHDKLKEYAQDIRIATLKDKIRKSELESLIGKLNFAASVVPARPFLRRMINLLKKADKPHYFIRLTKGIQRDLMTWLSFLENYNGITYFRALQLADSTVINMVSDASHKGFGACYGKKWLQARYPESWRHHHITILELYPIFVLINIFGHLMKNSNILFHCDNEAVTAIINKQSSKDNSVMQIVRPLILLLVKFNIYLRSQHIPGALNVLPDRISRFQVTPSLLQTYGMETHPTPIPSHLLPANYTID